MSEELYFIDISNIHYMFRYSSSLFYRYIQYPSYVQILFKSIEAHSELVVPLRHPDYREWEILDSWNY